MTHLIEVLFGHGKGLNCLQMSCRGILIFLITLALIRVSGRRSFGIRTPLDNIIVVLLGAILSRAVVGASAFLPTIATATVIVIVHRAFAYLIVHSKPFGKVVEGDKILLFKNGRFIHENMNKGLVSEEDIRQGVRESALTDSMAGIDSVYMERNGEISAIKKKD